jgi:tripartite-type tricarboxylate transporter receptor subunit TctC
MLQQPLYIGASHKSGITSLPQLIEMAKAKPGEITYAATGRGRLTHLTMELLQARTGTKLQLVPYAGGPAQAMNDVLSGRVHLVLDAYAGLAAALKGDLIKGLAATSLERLPGFENLPTGRRDHSRLLRRRLGRAAGAGRHAGCHRAQGHTDLWTALNDPDVKTSTRPTAHSCAT